MTPETGQTEKELSSSAGQIFRLEVSPHETHQDATGRAYLLEARRSGITSLTGCRASRLYFLQGHATPAEVRRLGEELLVDPVTETLAIDRLPPDGNFIEVTLLPGVTDPAAENLLRAVRLLGIEGVTRAATGRRYQLDGDLSRDELDRLALALFANPAIQRFSINQPIAPPFFAYRPADDTVEIIPLCQADDAALLAISQERRLALNLAEMQAIRAYYRKEAREPSDVELETLAQTWSEHCYHKSFKATIEYTGPEGQVEVIDGLLGATIRAATEKVNKEWVRSAFVDNAGIIAFDDRFDLAFKVETHNHPSALEPFGGANTGIGGVVRDVLGVGARPIANTDVLCFGPLDLPVADVPAGVLHPRRIAAGVIAGIEDYGNKMGIPTVNGSIHYHPGYTANPLVYCGCLGLLPHGSHATGAQPGDLIVSIGGRTGRDGLRGATFSSMEMDVATGEVAGTAVQIGNPIMEKQVQEVILRARDERLYHAITDCGAGGFSSAVGEMGQALGVRVQLADVPLKYPGLRPWEIWLSEAQERMVLAVPPAGWERLERICAGEDVEATILGVFTDSGRLELFYGDKRVGDLKMAFLHDGIPRQRLTAVWRGGEKENLPGAPEAAGTGERLTPGQLLLKLLAHPDIRSKEEIISRYDYEVGGATAGKPLVGRAGAGPGDAAVLVPAETLEKPEAGGAPAHLSPQGAALSNGICPRYSRLDPYIMAWAAVDEAMRNIVAVGADPDRVALLDNFCWGNPNLPDRLGALVRCAKGCHDAALAYDTPFISGKDSLNNEYTDPAGRKHAIPGTLLISAVGIVPDAGRTVSMDIKRAGNFLFLLGETRAELGGSHFGQVGGRVESHHQVPPQPVPGALERMRALHRTMQAGLVQACHDCAEGGIAVALAEMCIAGGLGAEVKFGAAPRDDYAAYAADEAILFSESLSRFIVEIRPEDVPHFDKIMAEVPHACFGVIGGERLRIYGRFDNLLVDIGLAELEAAWRGHLRPATSALPNGKESGRRRPHNAAPPAPAHVRPPRVLILHANGVNRDRDAALACRLAGGIPEIVHINQLLAGERRLADYHMVVLPGGFSYGDDLGAGVLWALDLRRRLGEAMRRFVADGRPVLGICNGFQALLKAGLLPVEAPESSLGERAVTLTFNRSGRFECRWVYLQPNPASPSLFTRGLAEPIYCPVAHGEGRLVVRDEAALAALQAGNLVALSYAAPGSADEPGYPANPNGSAGNIAGLCNPAGNVLGLMPHPEDHIFPWQHPRRHRGGQGMMGLRLFENGIRCA